MIVCERIRDDYVEINEYYHKETLKFPNIIDNPPESNGGASDIIAETLGFYYIMTDIERGK